MKWTGYVTLITLSLTHYLLPLSVWSNLTKNVRSLNSISVQEVRSNCHTKNVNGWITYNDSFRMMRPVEQQGWIRFCCHRRLMMIHWSHCSRTPWLELESADVCGKTYLSRGWWLRCSKKIWGLVVLYFKQLLGTLMG